MGEKERSKADETIRRVGRPQAPLLNLTKQGKPQLDVLFSFFLSLNNRDSTFEFKA